MDLLRRFKNYRPRDSKGRFMKLSKVDNSPRSFHLLTGEQGFKIIEKLLNEYGKETRT